MTLTRPSPIVMPWRGAAGAQAGLLNTVPVASAAGAATGAASYADGFPINAMTASSLGGHPPSGADLNGILHDLSNQALWFGAGGLAGFSSALCTAIGGYPKGSVLLLSDGATAVINTTAGNTNDPNSSRTGWLTFNALPRANAQVNVNPGGVAIGPSLGDYNFAGLGLLITPLSSGNLFVSVSGNVDLTFSTATGIAYKLMYGSDTPPNQDDPAKGVMVANPQQITAAAGQSGSPLPFARSGLITGLTPGIQYWIDMAMQASSSGVLTMAANYVNLTAMEL